MTRAETMKKRLVAGFAEAQYDLIDELVETFGQYEYLRMHFLKPGECFTTPDGACLGVGCMHDMLAKDPQ